MPKSDTEPERVFKALCDARRLSIVALLRGGEKCVCELASSLDLGQSAISYHMKILCESGVVSCRQEGKWTYYVLDRTGCEHAQTLLAEVLGLENGTTGDAHARRGIE